MRISRKFKILGILGCYFEIQFVIYREEEEESAVDFETSIFTTENRNCQNLRSSFLTRISAAHFGFKTK